MRKETTVPSTQEAQGVRRPEVFTSNQELFLTKLTTFFYEETGGQPLSPNQLIIGATLLDVLQTVPPDINDEQRDLVLTGLETMKTITQQGQGEKTPEEKAQEARRTLIFERTTGAPLERTTNNITFVADILGRIMKQ